MPSQIALLSTALPLQAGQPVQLTPAGEFAAWDGRPGKGLKWKLSNEDGRALCKHMNERHQKGAAFNFDYEHQAVLSEQNGQPAPASGWSRTFEWRDDVGLFAHPVEWTKRAAAHLEADEYRYISPALLYDNKTGRVNGVLNASLTNTPALDEMPGVMARLSAQFSSSTPDPEQSSMNLAQLLAALGLPATASEAEATSAIATLRQRADRADDLNTQLVTLRAAPPDAAKFVPIDRFNAINTELVTLKAASVAAEVDKVIDDAKAAGKVVSDVVEATWRDIGKSDLVLLKKLVDGMPANPALAGQRQSAGKNPSGDGGGEPTGDELAVCRAMGVDPATYRKGAA
ncbi:phage protease [Pseudacidovorax intermedius]|uniref:phage protease n=1 Tax=Pseudacidovorax intermedius TaxID=433924 RepID=UPI0026F10495|nr:phage protease [Pseudacidovorax intermedius]